MNSILGEALAYDDILLVPSKSLKSRRTANTSSRLTKKVSLEVPIISANMDTVTESEMMNAMADFGALGALHRNNTIQQEVEELKKHINYLQVIGKPDYPVAASVGVTEGHKERADELIKQGASIIIIDIAHGYADSVADMIKYIKDKHSPIEIIAGNVANGDAVEFLIEAGADCIKAGIGNGGLCSTRLVTGCGVPTITALRNCVEVADQYDIPIIADGSIRYGGDILKAFWAGAESVMVGGLFSATDESPGDIEVINGQKYKEYRGMASHKARQAIDTDHNDIAAEGVSTHKPYKGSVKPILQELIGGFKSGMSYVSADTTDKICRAKAYKMTGSGLQESIPHGKVL